MNVTQFFINKTKQATVQWYCRQNNKLTIALKIRIIEVNLFLLFAKELQTLTQVLLYCLIRFKAHICWRWLTPLESASTEVNWLSSWVNKISQAFKNQKKKSLRLCLHIWPFLAALQYAEQSSDEEYGLRDQTS